MAEINRRLFLKYSAHTSLAGFAVLQGSALGRSRVAPEPRLANAAEGSYGTLRPAGPDLALPPGFQYRRFGIAGDVMSDGRPTPARHDGMAAFTLPNGNIRLIRNHEVRRRPEGGPVVEPTYDPWAGGGTTSLEIDATTREIVRDFVSLSGTVRNCAGGPTPWGSWLTCEEAVVGETRGAGRPHGYVFEVPVDAAEPVDPMPLRAMGRFIHEALAVDPTTGVVYLTEDFGRAGFYRFVPERPYRRGESRGDLTVGGALQMLAVAERPNVDCNDGQEVGVGLPVEWIDIDDPDPPTAEADPAAVFEQGWSRGAARFSEVEGCWWGDGGVYFSCTNGGDARCGQIWHYGPHGNRDGELRLVFESPSTEVLDSPDNLCVSPRGGVIICEDGSFRQFVRGLTPAGTLFDFAENICNDSEFAGATFSPDGETLFLNIQDDPGATYAVWGPWERGGL